MTATACHPTVHGTPYRRRRRTLRYVLTWPLVLTIDAILWCLGGQTWRSLRGEGAWGLVRQ